jgi:hypothetical protein
MDKLDKIQATRHANLLALVAECGTQVAFANKIGRKKEQVSPLFSGKKGIGKKLARDIETKCGRPMFWLDEDHLALKDAELSLLMRRAMAEDPEGVKLILTTYFLGKDSRSP